MEAFLHPLQGLAEFEGIKKRCGANCGILNVSGCMESQKVSEEYSLVIFFNCFALRSKVRSEELPAEESMLL